jgi:hypothetical protein
MSDNILTAVLTFSLLAGGSAAIGSEMFGTRQSAKVATPVVVLPKVSVTAQRVGSAEIVTMPQVTITAHRAEPDDVVTMPAVVVTGRREAVTVAAETRASETPRVQ